MKKIIKINLILGFLTALLLLPSNAFAAFTCSLVSGCPTGDAALGVNFTGLQPLDLSAGSFTVTASSGGGYSCDYSSGIAANLSSCTAYYNSSTGNIECLIEHLDCRNNPFSLSVSAPSGYSCSVSPTSTNLANCSDNSPITVSCTPPAPTCATSCGACPGTNTCGNWTYQYCDTSPCSAAGASASTQFTCWANPDHTGCSYSQYTCNSCAPAPVPSAPTNLSASCPSPGTTSSLGWSDSSRATYYALRVNNTTDGWDGSCSSPAGDFCASPASSAYTFSSTAGATYGWWVHACNSSGCSSPVSGSNFTCTSGGFLPLTIQCAALDSTGTPITTANTNQPVTWKTTIVDGTAPFSYIWSGTDSLSSTTSSSTNRTNTTNKTYTTAGSKSATIVVTDSFSPIQTKSASCSVTINSPAPTVDIKANGSDGPVTGLAYNSSPTLSWTTTNNPTSCSASGSWSGSKSTTSGSSEVVGPLTGPANYTYTLTCTNAAAQTATDSVAVSVNGSTGTPPSCTPESNSTFCSRLGKNCGSVTASDNCGTPRTVTCGVCISPTSTPTPTPTSAPSSGYPWIQTVNGDVHSNTGIIVGP